MGGGVMLDEDFAGGDVEAAVRRVGTLPDAPLVMPKQRLESSDAPGFFTRWLFRPHVPGGARTSER